MKGGIELIYERWASGWTSKYFAAQKKIIPIFKFKWPQMSAWDQLAICNTKLGNKSFTIIYNGRKKYRKSISSILYSGLLFVFAFEPINSKCLGLQTNKPPFSICFLDITNAYERYICLISPCFSSSASPRLWKKI